MALFDFGKNEDNIVEHNHKAITAGSVVKYMVLPRILPRLAEFISTGFKTFAFFMACVLSTIRLIPASHEYLRPHNIGKFGIIQVLAAAANNLEFRKDKADQIIIFGIVVTALALLALQIFTLLVTFVMTPAFAQIANVFDPYPAFVPAGAGVGVGADGRYDIAMILLDRIFGVPGLFDSCVSILQPCTGINADGTNAVNEVQSTANTFPWPFHRGLHNMYLLYSLALLVVGMFIFIYFIMVVLIETAQTGTPFGRRFNSVWAPIRMVVAIGLLVPFAFGMNSAQFITLYAAKWGSGLATTAWFQFNSNLAQLTTEQELLGVPKAPTAMQLLSFMSLAYACEFIEADHFPWNYQSTQPGLNPMPQRYIDGYLIKNDPTPSNQTLLFTATDYPGAMNFYENGNVIIRFGDEDPSYQNNGVPPIYKNEKGLVKNSCGEILLTTTDMGSAGASYLYEGYYELVNTLWGGGNGLLPTSSAPGAQDCNAAGDLEQLAQALGDSSQQWVASRMKVSGNAAGGVGTTDYFITADTKQSMHQTVTNVLQCLINNAVREERADTGAFDIPPELLVRGWAGAGIWYNKIAAANGSLVTAARNVPKVITYPLIMERVSQAKLRVDPNVTSDDLYNPTVNDGKMLQLPRGNAEVVAGQVYYDLYRFWLTDLERVGRPSSSGNFLGKLIMDLFGLEGLYSITENNDVHPLAKLVGVGKGLIDSTIQNLTIGTGAIFGGAVLGMVDHPLAKIGQQFGEVGGDIMFSLATVGLTAGFVLYYVIPFLPFIYFFFAVGNWIKTVFEAMVGVPLWALAHIRIDGNGLPGDAAINGYYLIFEIFLRPIMIIFGLIAGISIFAAMAAVLHDIWDIVVANVGGTGAAEQAGFIESIRGPVDKLFYLVVYTIVLYMMAISSFKLVELIPQQILRWLGASVPTFVDQSQDAAGGLVQYAAIGGGHMFGQLTQGTQGAMKQMAGAISK